MRFSTSSCSRQRYLALQCIIGVVTVIAMAWPPHHPSKILLVPLTPTAVSDLVPLAVERGALLIDAGPLPGSIIVLADGGTIAGPLFRHGILAIATLQAGCSAATGDRA